MSDQWIAVEERLPETRQADGYETSDWLLGWWADNDSVYAPFGACLFERGATWQHWLNECLEECNAPTHYCKPSPPEVEP
jgi:hypothetical protein